MGTLRRVISITLAAGLAVTPVAAAAHSPVYSGLIRVNQLGYTGGAGEAAYLMTGQVAAGARFEVVDRRGRRVLSGRAGQDAGSWNAAYKHVYKLDLTGLRRP